MEVKERGLEVKKRKKENEDKGEWYRERKQKTNRKVRLS